MIRAGLAEVYRGKPPQGLNMAPHQKAEAKQEQRWMWSLGDKCVSPKE